MRGEGVGSSGPTSSPLFYGIYKLADKMRESMLLGHAKRLGVPVMGSVSMFRKVAIATAVGLGGVLVLSGCAQLTSLPDEERYQYINQVKDDLGYADTGKVVREQYDTGDGVFSPSFFYTEIEGPTTFDRLTETSQELATQQCNLLVDIQTRCDVGQVSILISRDSLEDTSITLKITDASNGRNQDLSK